VFDDGRGWIKELKMTNPPNAIILLTKGRKKRRWGDASTARMLAAKENIDPSVDELCDLKKAYQRKTTTLFRDQRTLGMGGEPIHRCPAVEESRAENSKRETKKKISIDHKRNLEAIIARGAKAGRIEQ